MSEIWIDKKWIATISPQLTNFRWINNDTANFRCPICGDSQKSKQKARGYLFVHNGSYIFKCHNTGYTLPFKAFLEKAFPEHADEYRMDVMRHKLGHEHVSAPVQDEPLEKRKQHTPSPSTLLKNYITLPITSLSEGHAAVKYVQNRQIPHEQWKRIYFTENFGQFVVDASGNSKYNKLPRDPRILLMLRDHNDHVIGMQGRKISDKGNAPKYITVKFDDDAPKLFGREYLQEDKPIMVVEGPIDSLFLPNSLALCGGDVAHSLKRYADRQVYVALDNEPRNKDTVRRMQRAIDLGFNVTFWPEDWDAKDINDMVLAYGRRQVIKTICEYSLCGLHAKARLQQWKRVDLNKSSQSRRRGQRHAERSQAGDPLSRL